MTINSTIAVPRVQPLRRWKVRWLAPAATLAAVAVALALYRPWSQASGRVEGTFHVVVPTDLEVKIIKDGELQAIEYTDIKNKVEGLNQIIELVKEGTTVKKGDKLVVLDSSNLVQRKQDLDMSVSKAESALAISEEMQRIQELQNAANEEAAKVTQELAELDLEEYREGTFKQALDNAKTALRMADIDLKTKEEELSQSESLFAKGFVTASDVKKAQIDVTRAQNEVRKASTALNVLEKYTSRMELARLNSVVAQAKQRYARVLRENRALLSQRLADVSEKQASLTELKKRAEHLQEQIDACTIRAPEDGLVIYASTIDRWGPGPIQEGSQVRERQWLLRLPDVRAMKAVLRIPEALVSKLDVEKKQRAMVKIVGHPQPVGATLTKVSVLADSSSRWWNPDLKEYPVELTLDQTPQGLKPGIGCQAEIFIDRYEDVLAVPLASIYTVGADSYVFVRGGEDVVHRKVTIGASNETFAQVTDGLVEGEQVLLLQAGQGRQLLERAGIKTDAATRPSRENGERPSRREGRNRGSEGSSAAAR